MKKLIVSASLTVALMLAGCSEAEDTTKEADTEANVDKSKEASKEFAKKKETTDPNNEKSDFGMKKIQYTKDNLGIAKKLGPIDFKINSVQISRLMIDEPSRAIFEDKEEVTLIILGVDVENMSDDTVSFYPDQAVLTTNTGEQIDAEMMFVDEIGGDFIGKVKKSGEIVFLAESDPKEITNIKYIVDGPSDENFEPLAEKYTVEIPTK